MRSLKLIGIIMTGFVLVFFMSSVMAGEFEGKITQRNISVSLAAIGQSGSTEPSDIAQNVFSKSPAELKQMAQKSGSMDDYSEGNIPFGLRAKNTGSIPGRMAKTSLLFMI